MSKLKNEGFQLLSKLFGLNCIVLHVEMSAIWLIARVRGRILPFARPALRWKR